MRFSLEPEHGALSRRPILNRDSGDRVQVGVLRNHDAIRKRAGNRSDLHVDLLDHSAGAPQFAEYQSVFLGGLLAVGPDKQARQRMAQALQIPFAAGAAFYSRPQFAEDRDANADAVPEVTLAISAGANTVTTLLKVLSDARVELVSSDHVPPPKPICLRTASRLWRRDSSR